MFYVCLLRSESSPKQVYTGFTEDLRQRLADHNVGLNTHTKRFMPWVLETYLAFSEREQALDFERYLKTVSGIAFGRKRLRLSAPTARTNEGPLAFEERRVGLSAISTRGP